MRNLFFSVLTGLVLLLNPLSAYGAQSPRDEGWKLLLSAIEDIQPIDLLQLLVADKAENDPPPAMLAHMMYASGRFDIAAFYFSVDFDLNPDNVESLANLSGILVELNTADPEKFPDVFLEWAEETARQAVALRPDNADVGRNLSFVLQAVAQNSAQKRALLDEALGLANAAVDFDPDALENWTNLARVQYLRDQQEKVDAALSMARKADPSDPGYALTAVALNRIPVPYEGDTEPGGLSKPQLCTVNFQCSKICPKSIIGQVNFVSCMLENDTQQKNCQAGKPFATAYNCEEEFPVFGAVPGLSNVASICVPGFCFHFRLKGNGDVDIRIEAGPNFGPIKPVIGGEIKYTNKNGFSVTKVTNGMKFSLYNRSAAGNLAGRKAEINPLEIKISTTDNKPVTLDGSIMGKVLIKY
jgi:tetratricopeptide (TPR) repeat protein